MRRLLTTTVLGAALVASAAACAVPSPAPSGGPGSTTLTVTRVVDGDTIDVSSGERIRLIGIDAQETGTGTCAATATNHLDGMVRGQQVTLSTGARDDRDRYGRLLRYVDVAGQDAGRMLIGEGLAIARYDSRDGYGAHARQDDYVAYDAMTPDCTSAGAPSGGLDGTDPRFSTCTAAKSGGYGPYVAGVDSEYSWYTDADHDGIVCE